MKPGKARKPALETIPTRRTTREGKKGTGKCGWKTPTKYQKKKRKLITEI